jgi:RimJ/RimL family protein N-acetyltransferase
MRIQPKAHPARQNRPPLFEARFHIRGYGQFMAETLETSRLLLAPWDEDGEALPARLAADPLVVRYIGDRRPWSPERVDLVARWASEHRNAHGFGWRVVIEKETREAVGFSALNVLGEGTVGLDPGELEVGWWLVPLARGRGLASEAANAMCREAFEHVGAPSAIARLQPENGAPPGVVVRLGMSHVLDTAGRFGEALAVYRLLAGDWLERSGSGVTSWPSDAPS